MCDPQDELTFSLPASRDFHPPPYRVVPSPEPVFISFATPCPYDAIRVVNGRLLTFPLRCPLCNAEFDQDVAAYEAHCRQHIENGDVG